MSATFGGQDIAKDLQVVGVIEDEEPVYVGFEPVLDDLYNALLFSGILFWLASQMIRSGAGR